MEWRVEVVDHKGVTEIHKTSLMNEVMDLVAKLMLCSEIEAIRIVILRGDEE